MLPVHRLDRLQGVGVEFDRDESGGLAFVVIGLTVWSLNWVICFFGAKAAGLDAGYIPGLIAGSYTITAVMGVGRCALQSDAFTPPDGMTAEEVSAKMAAGYAISYILSSIGIILLIGLMAVKHPYVGRRLLIMVPTLGIISVVAFYLIQLPPGDYVSARILELELEGDEQALQEIAERVSLGPADAFIQKPYRMPELLEVLTRVVGR